ncbi:type IV secretory system conjugative DNA transfer family protein, partial [Enterococcus gallinarum]
FFNSVTHPTKDVKNTTGDDFWIKAEGLLVRSLIAYLWFDGRRNDYKPHLGMISDILSHLKRKDKNVHSTFEERIQEFNYSQTDNYA